MNLSLFFTKGEDTVGAFTRDCHGTTKKALDLAIDVMDLLEGDCPMNSLLRYLDGWKTIDNAEDSEIHYIDDVSVIYDLDSSKVDVEGAFEKTTSYDGIGSLDDVHEIICSVLQELSYDEVTRLQNEIENDDYFTDDSLLLSVVR